jgi:RimJ/RimL family protein N-acetyltransferase
LPAVEATPNVDNIASIKMQEAVGAVRVGEAVYTFPESMQAYTVPVHHTIYRLYRSTWAERHGQRPAGRT